MSNAGSPRPDGWRLHYRFEVTGRPAAFATTAEVAWRSAVASAVAGRPFPQPASARFKVILEFRTTSKRPDERWDIDNLVKPTLDAMEAIFGRRRWRGLVQAQDDRVDELIARKRSTRKGEASGASIEVWYRTETAEDVFESSENEV